MSNPIPQHRFQTQTELELYEHALHVANLIRAAEMLAEAMPDLHLTDTPPIRYLLEVASAEIDALAGRLSD